MTTALRMRKKASMAREVELPATKPNPVQIGDRIPARTAMLS